MKLAAVVGVTLTTLSLSGCHMGLSIGGKPKLAGTGPIKTETRILSGYDKLDVDGNFVVDVKIGPADKLQIEAQENLISDIKTDVKDGFLRIKTEHHLESDKPIIVTITSPKLLALNGASGAEIRLSGVTGQTFSADITGGGQLTASGTADELTISSSGGANIDWTGIAAKNLTLGGSGGPHAHLEGAADEAKLSFNGGCNFEGEKLRTKIAVIESDGGCNISLAVKDDLTVDATGGGSIRYIGSPKTTSNVSGGVSLTKG